MSSLADRPDAEDEYHGTEIVVVDLGTDIFNYQLPLDGRITVARAKALAAEGIAKMIVDKIEPEYQEMAGFELMKYRLIIKKHN